MEKKGKCITTDLSPAVILQQVREVYDGGPWPEDTERRRKAALRKFLHLNPDYLQSLEGKGNFILGESRGLSPVHFRSSSVSERRKPVGRFWSVDLDLKLLDATKAFLRSNRLGKIISKVEKWKVIAASVPNPFDRDIITFARSCEVRFDNIRRIYRKARVGQLEGEVQQSLMEIFRICELNRAPGTER